MKSSKTVFFGPFLDPQKGPKTRIYVNRGGVKTVIFRPPGGGPPRGGSPAREAISNPAIVFDRADVVAEWRGMFPQRPHRALRTP